MDKYVLIDTDILVDVARGIPEALAFLQRLSRESVICLSAVTQMELLVGARNLREIRVLERFLYRFQIIKVNEPICDRAVELLRRYRLSHGLLIADAFIAATALYMQQPLSTRNRRDYRFITDLKLMTYP